MQAGSRCIVARWAGGLEWRGSCFGAGAGWGRQPCLRPTVHPVRGRVRRDGTKWTPLASLQQATVNRMRTRGGSHSSPYCFSRNTCAVSVAEEWTTVRPGQDNEARMGTGHVRPSRPPPPFPPVPRRGVPSIAQCVESWSRLRNAHEDRSSRSSFLHRETRSIPTQEGMLPPLLQKHHGPIGVATWQAPIPRM